MSAISGNGKFELNGGNGGPKGGGGGAGGRLSINLLEGYLKKNRA